MHSYNKKVKNMQYKVCHFTVKYENVTIQKLVHKYIFDTTRRYKYCKTWDRKTIQEYVNETTTQTYTHENKGIHTPDDTGIHT